MSCLVLTPSETNNLLYVAMIQVGGLPPTQAVPPAPVEEINTNEQRRKVYRAVTFSERDGIRKFRLKLAHECSNAGHPGYKMTMFIDWFLRVFAYEQEHAGAAMPVCDLIRQIGPKNYRTIRQHYIGARGQPWTGNGARHLYAYDPSGLTIAIRPEILDDCARSMCNELLSHR